MSKLKLDKILNKVGNKIGKILGSLCVCYRPISYLSPVAVENQVKSKYAAFLLDANFTKTLDYTFQIFTVEADTTDVNAGDIFIDNTDTYVIVSARVAESCKAILANGVITVNRPVYGSVTPGLFGPTISAIATDLPVNIYAKKGNPKFKEVTGKPVSNGFTINYEIRMFTNEQIIKVGDQIVDSDSVKSVITSIDFGPLGYTIYSQSI